MIGLSQVTLAHIQFGGGTDAIFPFGFIYSLGEARLLEAQRDVQHSLMHYLDGSTEG